jgi:uncharacterized protein (TIGR02611 family)
MLIATARKLIIFVIGSTVVLLGVIMMVAPGPAFIVIPAGLAILATEFVWARYVLKRGKKHATVTWKKVSRRTGLNVWIARYFPPRTATGVPGPPVEPPKDCS